MKRLSRSVLITVLVLLVAVVPVLAGSTTKTLSTNYTVVNLSTTADASVTALYYKENGTTWAADADKTNFSVPMNFGMTTIAQYFDNTMTAGKGSVVLSSTEPLAAIVQIQARNQTATNGAYVGYTSGSNVFYIPQLQKGLTTASGVGNSQIMIQNIMNEQITAQVTLKGYPGSGQPDHTIPAFTIAAYSTKYYDLADDATITAPWYGSGVVTAQSGKQIAVVVNIFQGSNGLQTLNAFPQEKAGTGWQVPQFSSRLLNGFSTPIIIQNVSGGDIAAGDIDVVCLPTTGFSGNITKSNTAAVPNTGSFVVNPVADMTITPNWSGSCTVTATGNVVVFVQTRKPGVSDDTSAYEGFLSSGTDTQVVFPLMSKLQNNGFCTAAIIKNLSATTAADVHVKFVKGSGSPGSDYEFDVTIAAGQNLIYNLAISAEPFNGSGTSVGMPSLWFGSLIVTPKSGGSTQPIVGYAQLKNYKGLAGDTFMSHDAFNLP